MAEAPVEKRGQLAVLEEKLSTALGGEPGLGEGVLESKSEQRAMYERVSVLLPLVMQRL